jgi:hypothetical protein
MSWENPQEPAEPPIPEVAWDIRREGRAWRADEAQARFALTPEKFEMWQGKLFWSDADRVTVEPPRLAALAKPLPACRVGEPLIERHQHEAGRSEVACHQGRREVEGIRGAKGMGANHPFRALPDHIGREHVAPCPKTRPAPCRPPRPRAGRAGSGTRQACVRIIQALR